MGLGMLWTMHGLGIGGIELGKEAVHGAGVRQLGAGAVLKLGLGMRLALGFWLQLWLRLGNRSQLRMRLGFG